MKTFSADLEQALKALADSVVQDDKADREVLLRDLRKYELYFAGFQALFWDTVLRDWRTFENEALTRDPSIGDPDRYTKVVNVMRGHIESITAAITAQTPRTHFSPENPNDPDDINASEAFTALSRLLDMHNSAPMIFIKTVFLLYTQGPIFFYNYNKTDKAFGIHVKRTVQPTTFTQPQLLCADCGDPKEDEVCASCGGPTDGIEEEVEVEGQEVIEESYEKSREIIEVYGSTHVKVPRWITNQASTPYLCLEGEFPISFIKSLYPKKAASIGLAGDEREKEARRPLQNQTIQPSNTTLSRLWVRPWEYWRLSDEPRKLLEKQFPSGVYIVRIDNGVVLEAFDEDLDAHWTMTENPMSNRVYFDPLAKPIIPIQQMLNEGINMIWETIEQGIPMTFVDRDLIDVNKLNQTEAEIGGMVGTKISLGSGESIASKVFQTRSTSLPAELPDFIQLLIKLGEFVLGSLPGIWGGANEGGSKTLGEAERMRSSALQRLTLHWTMIKSAWNKMKLKACQEFKDNMVSDEEFVPGANSLSIPIRKQDMRGRVTGIYPETDDIFPLTWVDRAARYMDLIGTQNETINSVLFDIENSNLMRKAVATEDIYIPGLDQRNLQLNEIFKLLKSGPNPDGTPTVMPDEFVDNAEIHMTVTQNFLASTLGQWHKENNPEGYANVLAHLQYHQMMLEQQMAAQPTAPQTETTPTQGAESAPQ